MLRIKIYVEKKIKKSLIIACDGEAASGKSTGAKLISKKYNLLLINSGLFYRYASKLVIEEKPKNVISFLKSNSKIYPMKKLLQKIYIVKKLAIM